MKKILLPNYCLQLVAIVLLALCGVQQGNAATTAGVLYAGYCNGNATGSGEIIFNDAQVVSACVYLDDSTMTRFAGNQVVAIDYYIISKLSINSLTLWVRSSLDGENLVEKTLSKSDLVKGWNYTTLDVPMDIDGKACYVGYTYDQSRAAYIIATADESHAGGLLLKADDGEWSETTGSVLALECEVKGDNLPQYDAELEELSMSYDAVKLGQPIGVSGVVRNVAAQPFSSLQVTFESEGMPAMTMDVPLDREIGFRDSCIFGFSFTPDYSVPSDSIAFKFNVDSEDGHADLDYGNSQCTIAYGLLEQNYRRNLYIEEFTSEYCVYCPNAAGRLAQALRECENGFRAVVACHHSGFHYDPFTIDEADGPIASTFSIDYNPCFMYNRAKTGDSYNFSPSDYNDFIDAINYYAETEAGIEVNVFATVDKTAHTITATVNGDVNDDFTEANPYITVYLLENDVLAEAQKNQYGDVIDGYRHEHLLRGYNATWGEPLTITNGHYSYTYTFNYDPTVNEYSNLYVAAFVSQNGDTRAEKEVYNAGQVAMKYIGVHYGATGGLVGDVNGDGEVSVADVNDVIDLVLQGGYKPVADINGDGEVTVADVNAIIDILLQL